MAPRLADRRGSAARLGAAARHLIGTLLGGLFACPACGVRPAGAVGCCEPCRARSAHPGHDGDCLWLGAYEGPLGRLARALKYGSATNLSHWLGGALAEQVTRLGWRPDVVCPVPLHATRRRRRGFNQAELLARAMAAALGVPCRPLLLRHRATLPQATLGRGARAANVAGAFVARPPGIAGHSVLLVDDVLTTGATVAACAAALRLAGARRVRVAVVARAQRSSLIERNGAGPSG